MGCEPNFGTQSCPIEVEAEEDDGKGTCVHTKKMSRLEPSLPESITKDSSSLPLPTSLELVPYQKSSPPHLARNGSQDSANPEPVSPSIHDMGRLRNAESGNESPGFAEGSFSLDAPARSPGASRGFKRLTKAHKKEHSKAVSSQKTELEREMELFEAAEREEEALLLTSLRDNQSNECSTSPKSSNSVGSIQMNWKRGLSGMIGEHLKQGRRPGPNHQALVKEEDVCFACFDGGQLILCDKRSCPKAYHMECTGRESDFFATKGQWLCGWHVCASCSRSANVHCYMCPNAFCNGCSTEAEFLPVRKDRGLCDMCFHIVNMIENNSSVDPDGVKVDFDDEETYECLFKYYWKDLKQKISLSWSEINKAYRAKCEPLGKGGHADKLTDEGDRASDESDCRPVTRQSHCFKRKRGAKNSAAKDASCSEYEKEEEEDNEAKEVEEEEEIWSKPKRGRPKGRKFVGWASKELVDFLHSIKEDSKKPLTLILLNKLLLRYVEANKLNSGYRGQIMCDERLRRLFGKKIVGKFQMMKLLATHIASKRTASVKDNLSDRPDNVEVGKGNDKGQKPCKLRKKLNDSRQMEPDASSYASIDMKNISLIYLKRSLLEDLRRDPNFASKVTGAFVRIRVPSIVNKNDTCYRLVQIVGIKQVPNSRNNGRAAGPILEILNLHKREEITVDLVSSQDFTEEECQRLRQSVKCGVLKPITVGALQEKARVLREAKVKDWFDTELLRLSNLRDRASEKGRRKELRECVERLQVLSSQSEMERQLRAPIEVTSDPCMDPDYESDNGGNSMQETQGMKNLFASRSGRSHWERNSFQGKHHNHTDGCGWATAVPHSGTKVQGDHKDFEKDHRGHVSEKPAQGPGYDKNAGFKVGRKDADNNVIGLNSNCKGDGWGGKLQKNEKDIGWTGNVGVKKSDDWAVVAGSKQDGGWEANVVSNTKVEKWCGVNTVDDGWGEHESVGKGCVTGEDPWKQKKENCETEAGSFMKDTEKNTNEDGWEDEAVDNKRNNGWGSSAGANSNYDGWEPLEGGDGKDLGWGGNTGGNSKDDGWGGSAGDTGKDDGWGGNGGGNCKDDGWGGNAGGNNTDDGLRGNVGQKFNDGGWGGYAGGTSKDDGWGGSAGARGKDEDGESDTRAHKEDGGWGGNACSHRKDDGWGGNAGARGKDEDGESNTRAHKEDGGWGGNACSHRKDDGWGGNASVHNKDDGWGGNSSTHKKDDGRGAHSIDDGWGDIADAHSKDGGWGDCAGNSSKDVGWGPGNERGSSGWGKVDDNRRDHVLGNNSKDFERNSNWRNRLDKRGGFSGGDTRPPYKDRSAGFDRREGFSGADTRPPYRDTEGSGRTSGQINFLSTQVRGSVPDVSTRSGVTTNNEKEKIWYYQDPSKNIQGPFSMDQLRKWERTKLFPLDLKVWRAMEGQDASILLTDALLGRAHNDLPPGFGHRVDGSQSWSSTGWGAPQDIRSATVASKSKPGSSWQDRGARPKWDQDNTGNEGVSEKCGHGDSSAGARPWRSQGSDRLSPQDTGRDGFRGHREWGANSRDYSEHHHYPYKPGNDSRFSTKKKDFPCRYFKNGVCKKGDECDFRH